MTRERVGGFWIEGSRFRGWWAWPVEGRREDALWFTERQIAVAYAQMNSEMTVTG